MEQKNQTINDIYNHLTNNDSNTEFNKEPTNLKPFIRKGLDILFIGLNPATISNKKGHYFSVKQSLWKQLYLSGLTTKEINKDLADTLIFGTTQYNYKHWNYGITDLVIHQAESNSSKVKPTINDYIRLKTDILKYEPKIIIILHSKVLKGFIFKFLNIPPQPSNSGRMGNLILNCKSIFYNIAFPHGNSIPDSDKIQLYKQVKEELSQIKSNAT